MKTLGLIGGTGPESTIDYYRLLTNQYREKADGASPRIILTSGALKQMSEWLSAGALGKVTDVPSVFSRTDIKLVTPNEEEQNYIHEKYFGELLKDQFLPETRARFLEIADAMNAREGIEALILGGTEIPLLLRADEHNGIHFLDATRIHVDRLIQEMLR